MKQSTILALEGLSFRFAGQTNNFFDNVSISFPAGAVHFIRGQNGAGKSTLFNILQGSIGVRDVMVGGVALAGQKYHIDERDRSGLESLRAGVAMVQQAFDTMIADQLSFEQNLQAANFAQLPGLDVLPEHLPLPALVERFRIDMHKPAHLLSGGQRQVLAILMALQRQVKVLLLDEPTAALDQKNSMMVMEFLHELVAKTGLTVLIISHDRELIERYAAVGHYEIKVADDGKRSIDYVAKA